MTGHGRAVITATIVAALSLTAEAAAQTARADAWKRVPPAPTTCFLDDGFADKANKAYSDLSTEIAKQRDLNASVKKKYDAMDMMERMQRMQAAMMKDPQKAGKMIEASQQSAQASTTKTVDANEAVKKLDGVFEREKTKWTTEAAKAKKPVEARIEQLIATRTKSSGEAGVKWLTQADYTNYVGLVGELNTAYERACTAFFGQGGSFLAYLASLRTEVTEPMISAAESSDEAFASLMAMMDTPTGGYRGTAALDHVQAYLGRMVAAYSLRQLKRKADIPAP